MRPKVECDFAYIWWVYYNLGIIQLIIPTEQGLTLLTLQSTGTTLHTT
jgi:hypothetical protein